MDSDCNAKASCPDVSIGTIRAAHGQGCTIENEYTYIGRESKGSLFVMH